MSLGLLGGHFWHPDRNAHGRIPFSVELAYLHDAPPGFSIEAARDRVKRVLDLGGQVALRLDWKHRQALPPEGDDRAASDYAIACGDIAREPILRRVSWLVCGNEPNLEAENRDMGRPMAAYWAARCVFGHTRPTEATDNAYQYVRTYNPTMQVLLPAVAPFSPEAHGGRTMPKPIDGRGDWAPWESYQFDLGVCAYDNNWHADLGEIKSAMHTYAASGIDEIGPGEPFVDIREATFGAQFGSRWLQDGLYLLRQAQKQAYGSEWAPWVIVSESNVLRPPQTPEQDYPAGWWRQLVAYVNAMPNVMGLAAFVDQNYGGGWGETAMTEYRGRLADWDADHDWRLENGW